MKSWRLWWKLHSNGAVTREEVVDAGTPRWVHWLLDRRVAHLDGRSAVVRLGAP